MEKWKVVKEFPNYQVSNLGNVRNSKGKILKPFLKQKGYLQIQLYHQNKKKKFSVHRLVAEAFIPNPKNLPQVNHKNGIKIDNKTCNLEWCTQLENNLHAIKTRLRKPFSEQEKKIRSERMKKIRPKINNRFREVIGINLITNEFRVYHRIVDTKKDGFNPTNVYANCRGKPKWHKGWFWHYKEDDVSENIINKIKKYYQIYIEKKEKKGNICFANIKIDLEASDND